MCGVLAIVLGFLLLWKISDNGVQAYQLYLQAKVTMKENSREEIELEPEEKPIGYESIPVETFQVEEE